ncbi:hypothetical protein PYWP30_01178 [Pyrobaculum sp. WP30]|nr:hypothetical protein PYWP30_01178 [Pyrobaculum sp. WP30]
MHPTKLTPVLALVLIAAVALAQYPYERPAPLIVPGTKPTVLYDNCYPNACVGTLMPDHWPFGGTPPQALVAIGSPAFADYYSLTNQLRYLGVNLNPPVNMWFAGPIKPGVIRSGLRNLTTGIGIGFTALGEFAATLSNGVGGGLALARYNTTTKDLVVTETWATTKFDYISPADWLNGWTLSANLTIKDDTNQKNYWIFLHAFAVYSNRTHAGGGRGVALSLNTGKYGTQPTYPPKQWSLQPFTSSDIKPFRIVYDSPRLLIATGGVNKKVDLSTLDPNLLGAYVIIDVNFTLIFPKAWPYAIVYYNYSVTASIASKLLPYPMYLNSTAFSIRFEIDQVNGAPAAGTYNATIFTPKSCGNKTYTLLHATPYAIDYRNYEINFRNITMFAAVYPAATEFTPLNLAKLIPYKLRNFDIVLSPGYRKATLKSEGGDSGNIPFVILQWSNSTLDPKKYKSVAGSPVTYKGGVMFVYGYAYNVTNWAASNKPDPYIQALIERTVLHLPTLSPAQCTATTGICGSNFKFKIGVAGSMADPTDVLALGYVANVVGAPWYGLDIAPGAFQNLYTGSSTTGIYNFVNRTYFGGLPVVLAKLSNSFPYFYDRYYRFAFSKTFMFNQLSVVGGGATFTVGGPVVNMLTRYTQDFAWYAPFIHNYRTAPFPFAFDRNYVACGQCIGSLFTTVWNTARLFTANDTWAPITDKKTVGYAIISTAVDPNGTVILQIWGANAQDTYFAGKLLNDQRDSFTDAPAYIIVFEYNYATPLFVTAKVYKLSTIDPPKLVRTSRFVSVCDDVRFR